MAAGVNRLPPRLTTLAVFSSPTPNPFSPNRRVARSRPRLPPISISMDPALVDPVHLQALMLACAHSCAIRPLSATDAAARPEPVDIRKLCTAVAHSFLVVYKESDLQVHPSLQRRGIGRKILQKITWALHSRGIYDISVLCTAKERPFFESCGFDDDAMGSTTMMYTKSMQK